MENVVTLTRVIKRYGSHTVLEDINFSMEPGTLFGLVGLNGAGKTTLIRLLLGLLKPDFGEIVVLGLNPWGHAPGLYRQCGVVLENDGFWGNLTVMENLKIFASAKKLSWGSVEQYLDECWSAFPFVRRAKKVKHLSRGQRMQCALCRAFMGWPQVYFLDEPTIALDVDAYEHFCTLMRMAQKRGASAVISSHQLETIETLCTDIGLLQNKQISSISRIQRDVARLEWIITASYDARWAEIIKETTNLPVQYSEGAWNCMIVDPQKTVPLLVTRLVQAGCNIYEVRPQTNRLKDTVKVYYKQTNEGA